MAELTVLGSSGAWPEAGRACSAFLVRDGGARIVLDLGYGVLPRLLALCPDGEVDAVVITHEHPDHCVDVSGLARVRHYHAAGRPRVPLYCTAGVLDVLRAAEPTIDPESVFDVHVVHGRDSWRVGEHVEITTVPVPHHVPAVGVRLSGPSATIAYTGDSGPADALVELGADADLFVMEATLTEPDPGEVPRLLTAGQAAELAERAGAATLMLTHFWPGADRETAVREARAVFSGDVLAAEEGHTLTLRRPVQPQSSLRLDGT